MSIENLIDEVLMDSKKVTETNLDVKTINEKCCNVLDLYIPYINCGGCGISSLSIYRWIKKNFNLTDMYFVYVYTNRTEENFKINDKLVKQNRLKTLFAPSHIYLKIGNYFIDSNGCSKSMKSRYNSSHIEITEKQLIRSINFAKNWNDFFNRENVTKIEELLGINLSDIKIK